MATSRRGFLKTGALATFFGAVYVGAEGLTVGHEEGQALGLHSVGSAKIPQDVYADPVYSFTKATFDPYLNTVFTTRVGVVTINLTLVEVDDFTPKDSKNQRITDKGESFALIFNADRELIKGISIYELEHAALGKFNLFLGNTKSWNNPKKHFYQAVINHMRG